MNPAIRPVPPGTATVGTTRPVRLRAGARGPTGVAGTVDAMSVTRTFMAQDGGPNRPLRRTTWSARAFALGGLALAAVYTAAAVALDTGAEHISPFWMTAIAWTVAESLTGALRRGFRHHDWSAFSGYEFPEGDGDMDELISRTGRHSSLGGGSTAS